jgi:putative ABC transport system permease protein
LRTLGVELVEGRLLDDRDGAGAPRALVINETMARRYWPNGTALGAGVRFGPAATQPAYTVVGVVRDVRERGYQLAGKPGVYLSFAQALTTWALPEYLIVRVAGDPDAAIEPLRRIIRETDPDQPITAVRPMTDIIALNVADRRQQVILLGTFAALALLLAAVGLYGVLSYAVAQRSRELGLRLALGATTGNLLRMVVGRGLALTGTGLAIGAAVAWAATRAMQSVLYGVTPGDPPTYAAVAALLATVALVASYLPARRAARLDPTEVLRNE